MDMHDLKVGDWVRTPHGIGVVHAMPGEMGALRPYFVRVSMVESKTYKTGRIVEYTSVKHFRFLHHDPKEFTKYCPSCNEEESPFYLEDYICAWCRDTIYDYEEI